MLSSPGYSSLIVFKSSAAKLFLVIPDDTDDVSEPRRSKLKWTALKLIRKMIDISAHIFEVIH